MRSSGILVAVTCVLSAVLAAGARTASAQPYDSCLQGGRGGAGTIQLSLATGDYAVCCDNAFSIAGRGTLTQHGDCRFTIDDDGGIDHKVHADIDVCRFLGSAQIQAPTGTIQCSIQDVDTRDDDCHCVNQIPTLTPTAQNRTPSPTPPGNATAPPPSTPTRTPTFYYYGGSTNPPLPFPLNLIASLLGLVLLVWPTRPTSQTLKQPSES